MECGVFWNVAGSCLVCELLYALCHYCRSTHYWMSDWALCTWCNSSLRCSVWYLSVRFHLACFGALLSLAKITLNLVPLLLSDNKNNLSQFSVSHQVCMCREPLSNSSVASSLLFPQTSYTSKATVIISRRYSKREPRQFSIFLMFLWVDLTETGFLFTDWIPL